MAIKLKKKTKMQVLKEMKEYFKEGRETCDNMLAIIEKDIKKDEKKVKKND